MMSNMQQLVAPTLANPMTTVQQLVAPTSANPMTTMQHLIRGNRNVGFMSSDDNLMAKQIMETHTPDGRSFKVKPLLHIVQDIFARTNISTTTLEAANLRVCLYIESNIYVGMYRVLIFSAQKFIFQLALMYDA